MSRKPSPPPSQPIRWEILYVGKKAKPLGEVEATDEREAIEKAAVEFKQPAAKLMAVRCA